MCRKNLRFKRGGASQRGAVVVELAIAAVIVLLFAAGMVGFGRAFWYADALTKSVRDGARLLSSWPDKTTFSTLGVSGAKSLVVASANATSISPPLALSNVRVDCLGPSPDFSVMASCPSGTAPANVRVSISGFSLNLAQWLPFVGAGGDAGFGSISLAPQSTMRYMN